MNPYEEAQRIALQHPCRLAAETFHPRYRHPVGSEGKVLVLTVSAGHE